MIKSCNPEKSTYITSKKRTTSWIILKQQDSHLKTDQKKTYDLVPIGAYTGQGE